MSDRAESFIALARNDLELARLVSARDPGNAAFHLQQAAEKLAKAVLDIEGIPSGATHQIGALAALLPPTMFFVLTWRRSTGSVAMPLRPPCRAWVTTSSGQGFSRRRDQGSCELGR